MIERGAAESMMRTYALERGADLTVIGTIGTGMLFHLLIGGHAPKIVDTAPNEVLVVRSPREA